MKLARIFVAQIVLSSLLQGQDTPWPHRIPARIHSANGDIFMMTLGNVETPAADGIFDPATDEVILKNGSVLRNYYRDSLGVKFYNPIDKTRFPLPPSGWCSWYYYYQEINEEEVRRNALWVAENLKGFGAHYIQIDDGWQGKGHGNNDNRDWTTIDKRFPSGMDKLAAYIKSFGLSPGLWLAPHGQSNTAEVKNNPGVFLMKPDGSSASDTWEGNWLVDPSTRQSQQYLENLFSTLSGWGYDYFKIDGQPIVVNEYKKKKSFMKNPSEDTDALYRQTLGSIRSAIGPGRYLLGCWGIPTEGIGIMNGSRTGGDVLLGWDGFTVALDATMHRYYLHNIVWYCDPDVMLVRPPLTLDQARAWATLQGLTGQALMASDRMMDLPEDRVELLKRVYPAVDIRPMDLFPSDGNKRIWDLKVSHLNRAYDVVGVFNFDGDRSEQTVLSWSDLGLPKNTPVHVFDFWNREYLGAWSSGMAVDVAPTGCRVLTLMQDNGSIRLVSTSRHITQGWIDLVSLNSNKDGTSFAGKSRVVKNDPYEITFAFPRGMNFAMASATAKGSSGSLPVTISNHQGWATMRIESPGTGDVTWGVRFEPSVPYHFPVREPESISLERVGLDGVNVRWEAQYYLNAGYQVYLDGNLLGYASSTTFPIRGLGPDSSYTIDVKSVWDDGTESEKSARGVYSLRPMLPVELFLTELKPLKATSGWRAVGINRAVSGSPLSLGGERYTTGIGTHARSEIEYDVRGLYDSLTVLAGIDDANGNDTTKMEFSILGDGRELWRSGIVRKPDGPKRVGLNIGGVHRLVFHVGDGGDGIDYDHADWVEPRIMKRIP